MQHAKNRTSHRRACPRWEEVANTRVIGPVILTSIPIIIAVELERTIYYVQHTIQPKVLVCPNNFTTGITPGPWSKSYMTPKCVKVSETCAFKSFCIESVTLMGKMINRKPNKELCYYTHTPQECSMLSQHTLAAYIAFRQHCIHIPIAIVHYMECSP